MFLSICIGTLVCRLWILDVSAGAEFPSQVEISGRLWRLFSMGVAAIIACSVADLLVGTAEMSNTAIRSVFPALPAVILKTHFGRVWLIRMSGLVLISVVASTAGRRRDSRAFLYFLIGVGAMIAMTESASGHAADAGDFSVAEIIDWLHLLGALVWGGGLYILSLVILPDMVKTGEYAAPDIAGVAVKFSRIAVIAAGTIFLTALYNAWAYVGRIEALWGSPYGRTIAAKIVLFILLLILAAFNRYVGVPSLQEWAGFVPGKGGIIHRLAKPALAYFARNSKGCIAALRFMRFVGIETFLMTGVLLCVALLRHEIPARHFSHLEHIQASGGHMGVGHGTRIHLPGPGTVTFARIEKKPADIISGAPALLLVHLEDRKGGPLQGLTIHHERILHAVIIGRDLNVFAHIHPEDFEPITDEMLKKAVFPLRFTFPKAGRYLIGLDFALSDGLYSKTASVDVSGEPAMAEPEVDLAREKTFGKYRITLEPSPTRINAGMETMLRFFIKKNGQPVRDLEPYLGAPMHLAIVRSDLTYFMHTHGETPADNNARAGYTSSESRIHYGPEIDSLVVFPAPGIFKVFGQVNRHGKVLLFDFMVKVELRKPGS